MTSTKLSYLSNSTILFTGYTLLSLSLLPNEVVVGLADIITLLVLLDLVLCSLLLFPLLQPLKKMLHLYYITFYRFYQLY